MLRKLWSWRTALSRNIPLLFDDYKNSTTAYVTTTFATIPWIGFGVTSHVGFAITAVLLHVVPPIVYYYLYGPFGIEFNYTPTKESEDGRIPDKVPERKNEALLFNGEGSIFANVVISERLDDFRIQFSSPSEITVELLDVPRDEHTYDRAENALKGSNITQHQFLIVLNIVVENPTPRRREYPLEIIDLATGRTIVNVTLIDS